MVELPQIPGGWTKRTFDLPLGPLTLTLPADPDLFLDDPAVQAANQQTDYMPYWSTLWPAAIPTSSALQFAPWPVGSRVLELGCGLGLVGLAALQRGDAVLFTDHDPSCLQTVQFNAVQNGLPLPETLLLDWRTPLAEQFPVIIGCEVTYEAKLHAPLLDVLDAMLAEGGVSWISDPGRMQAPRFVSLARNRGYTVRILNGQGEVQTGCSVQQFQIFELRRA